MSCNTTENIVSALKETKSVQLSLAVAAVLFWIIAFSFNSWVALMLLFIILALMAGILCFFRSPHRNIPDGEKIIVAPADGKVIDIENVHEDVYLKASARKISIFLSVFDVHMNRIPCNGTVEYQVHTKGTFAPAYKRTASSANENNAIGIKSSDFGKIYFKQIAGLIARRVVTRLIIGQKVKKGELFGMIKFGSRTEIYLPEHITITIKTGDRVKAGETIIGKIKG